MGEGFKIQRQLPVFDTTMYLYKDGDQRTTLTGGWVQKDTNLATGSFTPDTGVYTYTKIGTTNAPAGIMWGTVNRIDLTDIAAIKMEISGGTFTGIQLDVLLCVDPAPAGADIFDRYYASADAKIYANTTTTQLSLNVSALSGLYYVFFGSLSYASGGASENYTLKKIWLEV